MMMCSELQAKLAEIDRNDLSVYMCTCNNHGEENMVIANLVHRDFSEVLASYGDTVNTRKPGEFRAIRKTNADSVTVQDATATNIPVKLDQHFHVTFLIKDFLRKSA